MLNHTIILPIDGGHYFPIEVLWDLSYDINIKVVFSNIFIPSGKNESCIEKYGKEIIEKEQGFNLERKSEIPISLYQLALIDFKNISSIHLVGTKEQLQFLLELLKILKLEISVLFSSTEDAKSLQTNKILSYEDIFTLNSQNFEARFLKYCDFLKQNIAEQKPNLEFSYHFKINSLIPENKTQMALSVENRIILQTLFELPQDYRKIFMRKFNKLKNQPLLFFKDMFKKYIKKIMKTLKIKYV